MAKKKVTKTRRVTVKSNAKKGSKVYKARSKRSNAAKSASKKRVIAFKY